MVENEEMEVEDQLTETNGHHKGAKIAKKAQLQGVTILSFKFLMGLEYVSLHWKEEG
jgi:hypothetical protein